MTLDDVENLVVSMSGLGQNCEVMVVGEVSALALELIDPFVMANPVDPHSLNLHLLHFFSPVMVMTLDFFDIDVPVSPDLRIGLDLYEGHQILLIYNYSRSVIYFLLI